MMKNQDLTQLFIDELADMYNSENQILKALPKLIKAASLPDLKEALTTHLHETEEQVERIEKIFSLMNLPVSDKICEAMRGLIKEADDLTQNKSKSATLDAAIISAAQKVEHYEIASYGTLRSFAKHLDLKSEITDLLQETLDEEGSADKKLTKIADGSFLSSGVNKEAVEEEFAHSSSHRKRK
ncbi:Protein YciF [Parachlamydia acanthamoebae]|nr:Protein YciF [Parachlamydia acanthamoebae]